MQGIPCPVTIDEAGLLVEAPNGTFLRVMAILRSPTERQHMPAWKGVATVLLGLRLARVPPTRFARLPCEFVFPATSHHLWCKVSVLIQRQAAQVTKRVYGDAVSHELAGVSKNARGSYQGMRHTSDVHMFRLAQDAAGIHASLVTRTTTAAMTI